MLLIRQHLKFMAKEHFSLLTADIRCIIKERWRKTFPGVKIKIPVDLIDFTFVTPVYPEII